MVSFNWHYASKVSKRLLFIRQHHTEVSKEIITFLLPNIHSGMARNSSLVPTLCVDITSKDRHTVSESHVTQPCESFCMRGLLDIDASGCGLRCLGDCNMEDALVWHWPVPQLLGLFNMVHKRVAHTSERRTSNPIQIQLSNMFLKSPILCRNNCNFAKRLFTV